VIPLYRPNKWYQSQWLKPTQASGGWECFHWRGSVPMWLKGLTLEWEIVRNPSVILSPTLARNEEVKHYIRININSLS